MVRGLMSVSYSYLSCIVYMLFGLVLKADIHYVKWFSVLLHEYKNIYSLFPNILASF
jgi:hypothetical protein